MSEPSDRMNDSAAKRRQDALSKELGIELWAKYPKELIEFRMDRPPKDEAKRSQWKPVHGPRARVYATYMRYSWCWPICMPYAVVTDERDEILRDHKSRPLVLSEDAVAEILDYSKQRVSKVVLDLVADKLIRVERAPSREHCMAVYLEAKPVLTEEDRRVKCTLDATGVEGPRLEPAVLRRFSSLLNQLGEDERLLSVPPDGSDGDAPRVVPARVYRTQIWREVLDNRTVFLKGLKQARYTEYQAYRAITTRVRNLIDQTQSSESDLRAAAADSTMAAAAAKSPPVEARVASTQPPAAARAQASQTRPAAPAPMEAAGDVLKRIPQAPAPDPQVQHLSEILTEWLGSVPYESARVLLEACRKRAPQAQPPVSDEEVLSVCSDIVLGKGGLKSANWKRLDNPMGLFVQVAPTYFPQKLHELRLRQ